MKFHPISEIFPLLEGDAFQALVDDIAEHGLREPIWLYQGEILDGRNRWRACREAGVEPRFNDYVGDPAGLLAFVISLNLHRRHLSESQRAMVAAKLTNLERGRPEKGTIVPVSAEQAGTLLNVSEKSVDRANAVREHGTPELVEAVEQGLIKVGTAAPLTRAEPAFQRAVVAKIHEGEKPTEAVRQVRKAATADKVQALPEGQYRVLYADPPWQYSYSREGEAKALLRRHAP